MRLAAVLYPRLWKQRYGREFSALLEDLDPCSSDALDVLKGAAVMQLTTWLVVGVAIMGGAVLAGAVSFYVTHHQSEKTSVEAADAEFEHLRARFAGQTPVLNMRERRPLPSVGTLQPAAPLHKFHTTVFDTRGGQRIVRMTVPYRFARLFGQGGSFRWLGQLTFLDDTEFDPEPIQLSLDEVARHGPGLVVDYRHATGGRFIAWVD